MNNLHYQFPFIHVDFKVVCDICHFAKHRKLHFSDSFNKDQKPFDLIHFDIWGSIATKSIHYHAYFFSAVGDCSR
jgi:hypothetical protein